MTISGLLTVKPANTPKVGDIRCYTVENRTAQSGNAWNKIKGATPDNGGQSYKVLTVKPTGRTDQYGNISLNIEIEPSSGSVSGGHTEQRGNAQAGAASTQHNGKPAWAGADNSKEGYWARKELADIEKQPRIERQHAQEMAIRYCALHVGEPPPTTEKLRELISWFQRDVVNVPEAPTKPEPPLRRTAGDQIHGELEAEPELTPDDNDEPF